MTRVALVDDQALLRAGLRALLDAEDDLEVVGEAGDGDGGGRARARSAARRRADGHPHAARSTAWRRRGGSWPSPSLAGVKVVVLTTFEVDEYVFEALRAGAAGFLLKDSDPEDIVRAVRVVAEGESLLSPSVTRRVVETFAAGAAPSAPAVGGLDELTEREAEVVALVGTGLSNAEIGERLVISPATARTHVSRAMLKLGARDRAQLVVFAYEAGLVTRGRGAT